MNTEMTLNRLKPVWARDVLAGALVATCIFAAPSFGQGSPTSVYNVATFGATPNDPTDDDGPSIRSAIDAALLFTGEAVVHFPSGEYDIRSKRAGGAHAIRIEKDAGLVPGVDFPSSITIRTAPNGIAKIVMREMAADELDPTGTKQNYGFLRVKDCLDVDISGFAIDYRDDNEFPTTFSQGTVLGVGGDLAADTGWTRISLDEGYRPFKVGTTRCYAVETATGAFKANVVNRAISAVIPEVPTPGGPLIFRLEHQYTPWQNDTLGAGDRIALGSPEPGASQAIQVEDIVGLSIHDLEINASPHSAIYIRDCDTISVDSVVLIPGIVLSNSTDPKRLISVTGDGIHLMSPRGAIQLTNNTLISTNDDGIAVHGFYSARGYEFVGAVSSSGSKRIRWTRKKEHHSAPRKFDVLRFFDRSTDTYVTRTVLLSVEDTSTPEDDFLLVLNDFVNHAIPGLVRVANLNTVGDFTLILNNTFDLNAGRGILYKGSNALIKGNTTNRTGFGGIAVISDLDNQESSVPQNVRILGNSVTKAGMWQSHKNQFRGGILVYHKGDSQDWDSADLHSNVRVENNDVSSCHGPNLFLSNITGAYVGGNSFSFVNAEGVAQSLATRPIDVEAVVHMEYVDGATFFDNHIYGTTPGDLGPVIVEFADAWLNNTNTLPATPDSAFTVHP